MKMIKSISAFLVGCFLWVHSGSCATFTGKKLYQLEFLVNHGDYEEALRVGKQLAEKNKDIDTATYIVTNCLLSKSAYHWYDFKLSDTYFSIALEDWKSSNLSAKNKFMVGLYLTELALDRNNPVQAGEISKELVSVKGVDFWYGHWFWILKAKIELSMGNYGEALANVNSSAGSLSNLRMEMGDKLGAEEEFKMLCLRGEILVASGNWEKAATTIKEISDFKKKEHVSSPENNFHEDRLIGLFERAKSNFAKAHAAFLNAYNDLEANDYEYKKYDALKNAAYCASKAGMVTDVHQLMRRAEMLSMKDISSAHVFGPGQAAIRVNEFIESSQFEEAKSKSLSAQKRYDYLPEFHPTRLEYLQLHSQSVEANGDLLDYRVSLDTLAASLVRKYGNTSFRLDEVKLKMAEYEWKYGGDFNVSLALYQKHYGSGLSRNLYKTSPDHLRWLEGYAHVFEYMDKYDSALVKVSLAMDVAEKSLGVNSPEANYFKSLTALHLFNMGKYKESVDKLMSAYESNKKIIDNSTGYLAKACYIQAALFEWIGEFTFINKQIQKATQLMLAKEDNKYFEKVEGFEELGTAYTSKNNFYRAEKNFVNAITTIRRKSGNESFMLVDPLLAAADLKIQKGDIKEAENYLTDAEKLIEKYFSTESSRQARYLELQSNYYKAVSDEKQSMELMGTSISISGKLFGAKHVRLASVLAEKAHLYILEKNANKANETYEDAKQIIADGLGMNSPAFASLLVQQAELYVQVNKFDNAIVNLTEAEKYWINKMGAVNVNVASIYQTRGDLAYKQKKYSEAEKYFNRAALQYADLYNKKHAGYLKAGLGLAKVAYMVGDLKEASEIMERILDERIQFTVNNFSIMTFSQKSNLWADFREEFELYNSIVYKLNSEKRDGKKLANLYDYTIRTKGLLMNSDAQVRRMVYQSGDSALVTTFNDWLFEKEFFALVSYYSPAQLAEENISLEKVQKTIEDLEKRINSKTDNKVAQQSKVVHWTDVRNALSKDEVAVEMVKFRYFNQVFTDTVVYMAMVLDAKSMDGPKPVIMDKGKNMEGKNLRFYRNSAISKSEDEFSYDIYLKEIKSVVPDGYTIYFCGEGVYTQINPEMLYNPVSKKYALETNTFVFVTNTKDIISEPGSKKSNSKTKEPQPYYLYGNPQFYTSAPKDGKETIPSLVGAEKEILDINEVLKKQGKTVTNLIGKEVTEDTVRALQNPSVFHISTHGFFMEKKDERSTMASNPMLNSGLLLSGAGNILSDRKSGYINQTPGVLTASEVIDLNFTKTNLVILSACETGRGTVEVGEGVYGLQRAFLVAGAKAIVLSLFKVDDGATQLLMTKFYEKFLTNGGDYRKAFRESKQELRSSDTYKSPIYWGAFIMIEGHPSKQVVN